MEFMAPALLWAMGAAALPVLIHLTGRGKPEAHRFAAMRFLTRSQNIQSRLLRIRHWLLLALRILLLIALALVFARPLWSVRALCFTQGAAGLIFAALAGWALFKREVIAGAAGLAGLAGLWQANLLESAPQHSRLKGDFVLVMDVSLSMSCQEPQGSRFDLARAQALDLLDRLAPDARVALILAGRTAERVQGRLSVQHENVRRRLLAAAPNGGGLNIAQALDAACEIAGRERRQDTRAPAWVIFFSDFQMGDYAALSAGSVPPAPRNTGLVLVNLASENAPNGAAVALQLPAQTLPASSLVTLRGLVRPLDKDRPCLVELYLDGRRERQDVIQPQGRDVVQIDLPCPTGSSGPHALRLCVADNDRLPMDQSVYAAYAAGLPPQALLIGTPESAGGSRGGSAFFLAAVMQPGRNDAPGDGGGSGLAVSVEAPQELTAGKLARFRAVVLADCGLLSDNSWNALAKWVESGGGLFVWPGPVTASHGLDAMQRYGCQEHMRNRGLVPGRIGGVLDFKTPLALDVARPEHPALLHMNGSALSALRRTRVRSALSIDPSVHDDAVSVILKLADGTPLLLEKTCGRGKVLLSAIDPGTAWSDLPRQAEVFVTLVLDCVRHLAGQDNEVHVRAGEPVLLPLSPAPAGRSVEWWKPDAKEPVLLTAWSDDSIALESAAERTAEVPVPPLEQLGLHRFSWRAAAGQKPETRWLALNADAGESVLRQASAELLREKLGAWNPVRVRNLSEVQNFHVLGEAAGGGFKREQAPFVLLLAALLMLCECFFSNRLQARASGIATDPAREAGHG